MTQNTLACVGLLTLSALISAVAQTGAPEGNTPEPPSTRAKMGPADVSGGHCSTTLNGPGAGDATATLAGTGAVSSVLQPLSPCLNAREHAELIGRFVDERLAVWRQRLNLEDWRISVVMTRRSDLKPKTRGRIRWDKDKKTAVIWVMDASDYQLPLHEMLDDMEFTIIHELVHLELASLPRSEASRRSEEHAVNRIAEALLRLSRQK
jgi:hypothetical protein